MRAGRRPLSHACQLGRLRAILPASRGQITPTGIVCWTRLSPLALSREYDARIEYRREKLPRAFIETPTLHHAKHGDPPHLYGPDEPCLFYPKEREWRPHQWIATTIVPWLLEWLAYYESWCATGVWQGEGVHPPKREA